MSELNVAELTPEEKVNKILDELFDAIDGIDEKIETMPSDRAGLRYTLDMNDAPQPVDRAKLKADGIEQKRILAKAAEEQIELAMSGESLDSKADITNKTIERIDNHIKSRKEKWLIKTKPLKKDLDQSQTFASRMRSMAREAGLEKPTSISVTINVPGKNDTAKSMMDTFNHNAVDISEPRSIGNSLNNLVAYGQMEADMDKDIDTPQRSISMDEI